MKLWKKAPVGGTYYKIYLASPEAIAKLNDGDPAVAITLHNDKKIVIGWDTPQEAFAGTLLHELTHAVIYESHIETTLSAKIKSWNEDEEEAIVKAIEATLTPALVALGWKPRKPKHRQ